MAESISAEAGSHLHSNEHSQPDALWGVHAPLLDLLPVAIYFCDAQGVVVRWNRCAAELWGREPRVGDDSERFCGSYKLYRANGSFMAHADCPMADALRTGQPQRIPEAIIERPDGSCRYVMANIDPIRDVHGGLIGAVNVLQDITERKRAEKAQRQTEKRFRRLLEKMPAAAYTCDSSGLITAFNQRAAELWGREPKLNDPIDRY